MVRIQNISNYIPSTILVPAWMFFLFRDKLPTFLARSLREIRYADIGWQCWPVQAICRLYVFWAVCSGPLMAIGLPWPVAVACCRGLYMSYKRHSLP